MTDTTAPTVLTFDDGRTFEVPSSWGDSTGAHVAGLDANGRPVAREDASSFFALTDCCGASATGTDLGIVCRNCYGDPVDDFVVEPVTLRTLDPATGLRLLVKALPQPLDEQCPWPAGPGPVRTDLNRYVAIHGFNDEVTWITFHGDVHAAAEALGPDDDWDLLATCDLTSRMSLEAAIMRIRLIELLNSHEMENHAAEQVADLLPTRPWPEMHRDRYALVQSSRDREVWITVFETIQALGEYDADTESSGDWYREEVVDLLTGQRLEVTATYVATPAR